MVLLNQPKSVNTAPIGRSEEYMSGRSGEVGVSKKSLFNIFPMKIKKINKTIKMHETFLPWPSLASGHPLGLLLLLLPPLH